MAIADLAAACDRLAESTSCPVVLEDQEYRVLAYSAVSGQAEDPARSAAILRRRTPDAWLQWISEQAEPSPIDDGAIHVVADPWPGLRRRAIKTLRMDGAVVGHLWLLEGERGFPPELQSAVDQFERHVLPSLAAEATSESTRLDTRMVRRIVEASLPLDECAAFLGLDRTAETVVTCFLLPGDGFMPVADVASAVDAVRTPQHDEKVAMVGSSIVRIEGLADLPLARVEENIAASARRLQRVVQGPVFAVSSPSTSMAALAKAWREVALGASTLRKLSRSGRYSSFDHLRVVVAWDVVMNAVSAQRDLFDSLIDPLVRDSRSDELVETLATVLREEGSVSRSATHLRLHQNSVRYRVERIRDALALDLDEPGARLALRLATARLDDLPVPGVQL